MDNTQAINVEQAQSEGSGRTKDPIVKSLMKVFWILLVVTLVEIGLALLHFFTFFPPRGILNGIFILLTIVKAFYIVAEFMHMRHELKSLAFTILIPLFFLLWGITAVLWEGGATGKSRKENTVVETTTPWENVQHEKY